MPLRCLSPWGQELAIQHDAESWAALRARNLAERHLKLPCCESPVVLKQSRLGTRFFAHHRRGTCTSAPESKEHLYLKEIVARAATRAGWFVTTEERGTSSTGLDWVADVLCSREGNSRSVAFEIQCTRQSLEDTAQRQQRYQASGIRALWLMRQWNVPVSKETPAFAVRIGEDSCAEVLMPSGTWPPNYMLHLMGRTEPRWGQRVALDAFIEGALHGRLKFAPAVGQVVPARAMGAQTTCWKCKRQTCLLLGIELLLERTFPGFENARIGLDRIGSDPLRGAQWLSAHLPLDPLRANGVGEVKPRYSRTMDERYLSNGCVHCDALQGRMYEHEVAWEQAPLFETEVPVEAWLAENEDEPALLKRWWFDSTASS
jgi:hypothetical protein